jgi:hypothetical protein
MNPDDDTTTVDIPGQLDIYGHEHGTPDPEWGEHFDIAEGHEP